MLIQGRCFRPYLKNREFRTKGYNSYKPKQQIMLRPKKKILKEYMRITLKNVAKWTSESKGLKRLYCLPKSKKTRIKIINQSKRCEKNLRSNFNQHIKGFWNYNLDKVKFLSFLQTIRLLITNSSKKCMKPRAPEKVVPYAHKSWMRSNDAQTPLRHRLRFRT